MPPDTSRIARGGPRKSLTEPFVDDLDHSILDFGAAVVIVRVVECLEDLINSQHWGTKKSVVPITLLMASSGFESVDQAFGFKFRILVKKIDQFMTNLDDKIYGVFNNDFCDFACWLVQDETEVVLSRRSASFPPKSRV